MNLYYQGINLIQRSIADIPSYGVRLFLLTGQSNAQGRAKDSDATAEEKAPQPEIQIWNPTASEFQDLDVGTNNLGGGGEHSIELGLGVNFLNYFPGEICYLVKYGVGGTEIAQHLEGGSVYTTFKSYFDDAVQAILDMGKIPYVYFIFSQGERDANIGTTQSAYKASYDQLISLWSGHIGGQPTWATYQIIRDCYPNEPAINAAFDQVDSERSRFFVVPTIDETTPDNLHFDYAAQKRASVSVLNFFKNNLGYRYNTWLDGGELVVKVPEVLNGEPGRGYTNTGLFYLKDETEARTDNKLIFWSQNWGRKDSGTAGRWPSVCKIAIDYAWGNNATTPTTYTADLLLEIDVDPLQASNYQGLIQRGDGRVICAGGYVIEPFGDAQGQVIQVGAKLSNLGSAIAYDKVNDKAIWTPNTTKEVYIVNPYTGNIEQDRTSEFGGFAELGSNNIDHVAVNTDLDILTVSYGGRSQQYYRWSTGAYIQGRAWSEHPIDIEGVPIVQAPDGTNYQFVSSDNWFHDDGNPDSDINAIWKLQLPFTVTW